MNTATAILWILAAGLLLFAWKRGDGSHKQGAKLGLKTLRNTLPIMLAAFAITGYVSVLSPQDLVSKWIGPDSGWTGVLVAEGVGMLLPGGPYVIFPLVAVLYDTGAGLAPVVTIVTSWSAVGLLRLAFEIPFMGWRFTVVRWGLAAITPLIVGGAALLLFGGS